MTKCEFDCTPLCDFCLHCDKSDPYAGESLCFQHNKIVDWTDDCEDFHCVRAANGKPQPTAADPVS